MRRTFRYLDVANDRSWKTACREALVEIDSFGLLLIAASLALILLPLGLAPKSRQGWGNPSMVHLLPSEIVWTGTDDQLGMIVLGMTLIPVFVWYEANYPSKPVFPMRWLARPVILGSCLIGFCDFVSFYLQNTFLYS